MKLTYVVYKDHTFKSKCPEANTQWESRFHKHLPFLARSFSKLPDLVLLVIIIIYFSNTEIPITCTPRREKKTLMLSIYITGPRLHAFHNNQILIIAAEPLNKLLFHLSTAMNEFKRILRSASDNLNDFFILHPVLKKFFYWFIAILASSFPYSSSLLPSPQPRVTATLG